MEEETNDVGVATTTARSLDRDADGAVSDLEHLTAAVDRLTTKYEMEVAAHRATTEQLIAQQQAHIETLREALRHPAD